MTRTRFALILAFVLLTASGISAPRAHASFFTGFIFNRTAGPQYAGQFDIGQPDNAALINDAYWNGNNCLSGHCGNFFGGMADQFSPGVGYNSANFLDGYPVGLWGDLAGYDVTTANRLCQIDDAVVAGGMGHPADPGVAVIPTSVTHMSMINLSRKNTLVFDGSTWGLLASEHHYSTLRDGSNLQGNPSGIVLDTGFTCISNGVPNPSFSIDRSSMSSGQTANISYNDNATYTAANVACDPISVSPSYPGYTPADSTPAPSCSGVRASPGFSASFSSSNYKVDCTAGGFSAPAQCTLNSSGSAVAICQSKCNSSCAGAGPGFPACVAACNTGCAMTYAGLTENAYTCTNTRSATIPVSPPAGSYDFYFACKNVNGVAPVRSVHLDVTTATCTDGVMPAGPGSCNVTNPACGISVSGSITCGGPGGISQCSDTNGNPLTAPNSLCPAPAAALSAPGSAIPYNTAASLNWSCTNSTSASISGLGTVWSGPFTPSVSNSVSTGNLIADTPYTLTCYGVNGNATDGPKTVSVSAQPLPDLQASGISIAPPPAMGVPSTISATISNTGTAATSGGFPVLFEMYNGSSPPPSFPAITALRSTNVVSPLAGSGASVPVSISYPFPSGGTWQVRACANTDTSNNVPAVSPPGVTEVPSGYGNNCSSSWTAVSVAWPAITQPGGAPITCSVSPTMGNVNTLFTWSATSASGGNGGPYTYTWSGSPPLAGQVGQTINNVQYPAGSGYTGSVTVTDSVGNTTGSIPCSTSVSNVYALPDCPNFPLSGVTPTDIALGSSVTVSWNCVNSSSCSAVSNPDFVTPPGNPTVHSQGVTPSSPGLGQQYGLVCKNPGSPSGVTILSNAFNVHQPSAQITAVPARVPPGNIVTISASGSWVASCSIGSGGLSNNVVATSSAVASSWAPATPPTPTISSQTLYTIYCKSPAGATYSANVLVNVDGTIIQF